MHIETLVFTVLLSSIAFATDQTANLYRAKCSPCHGKNGEGKRSMKAPSLVSNDAKKISDKEIRELIVARANGEMDPNPSHTFLKKRLTGVSDGANHRGHPEDAGKPPLTYCAAARSCTNQLRRIVAGSDYFRLADNPSAIAGRYSKAFSNRSRSFAS